MKQILSILALLGLAFPAFAAPAAPATPVAPPPVDKVVQKLQARYDSTSDLTAKVTQEMDIISLGHTITSHGTVYFERPGKMRWDMRNKDEQIIVADGKTLWVYQPAQKQVYKASIQQAFRSSTPASFLIGIGRIADDFKVSLDGEKDGLIYLKLVPRSGNDIGTLRLGVDSKTYDIRRAEIRDPLGNTTRLRFDDIQRNIALKDDLFHFDVPHGAEVFEAPKAPE